MIMAHIDTKTLARRYRKGIFAGNRQEAPW